eukprot:NODE_6261_length_287_cov_152.911765_g5649_i0.p2 GENE.NODE_6261_length_287_cov_152.911765_g5649_i0~~NODE_6261_length_287_cov_152.911765_g5649_i0.p2  ORF type:complete len:94 (-),score=49.20 NODE_6261_length_287_cov_152.911765_g5649_i0:4-258(-)
MGGGEGPNINQGMNTVELFDSTTGVWHPSPPMPTARFSLGVAAVDGMVYAVGGDIGDDTPTDIVERFDPRAGQKKKKKKKKTLR